MFKSRLLGHMAFALVWCLRKTLKVHIIQAPGYAPNTPFLFAFWHGKQLLPVLELRRHQTPRAVLVSPSRDGEILSVWLHHLNYQTIRGSSRQKNIQASKEMMRKLKEGYSLGFGIDGPVGPIYQVKPGMSHMAQKFNKGIIPVGSAFSQKWVFHKAWDRYEIPKPFSRAVLYLGSPVYITAEANLEQSNRQLEDKINNAEAAAKALLETLT